jgi:hypothetical protein
MDDRFPRVDHASPIHQRRSPLAMVEMKSDFHPAWLEIARG